MARDRAARPEAKPLRLFVAIEIPDAVKDAVEEAFAPWREAFPKARWVPRENLHVTLKFLGRTWPRLTDWVPERVGAAAADVPPFTARLQGRGELPLGEARPGALGGVRGSGPASQRSRPEIEAALVDEFPAEKRPFHPHLTVARWDPPLKLPSEYTATELESDGVGGGPRRPVPEPPRAARAPIRAARPLPARRPHKLAFEHLFD